MTRDTTVALLKDELSDVFSLSDGKASREPLEIEVAGELLKSLGERDSEGALGSRDVAMLRRLLAPASRTGSAARAALLKVLLACPAELVDDSGVEVEQRLRAALSRAVAEITETIRALLQEDVLGARYALASYCALWSRIHVVLAPFLAGRGIGQIELAFLGELSDNPLLRNFGVHDELLQAIERMRGQLMVNL